MINPEIVEMYRGYVIKQTQGGWFNIRRQSFGVASFCTLEEAKRNVDKLIELSLKECH